MLEAFWLGNKCLSSKCICIRKYHLGLSTPFSSNQPSQANSYLQTHYLVIVPHSSSSWLSFKHVLTLLLSRLLSTHWVLFPSEVPFAFLNITIMVHKDAIVGRPSQNRKLWRERPGVREAGLCPPPLREDRWPVSHNDDLGLLNCQRGEESLPAPSADGKF